MCICIFLYYSIILLLPNCVCDCSGLCAPSGIQWVVNYDLERGLRNRDIVPSSSASYTNQQLFDALASLYNTQPIIDCIYDKVSADTS